MTSIVTTKIDIMSIIQSFKSKNSAGYEGISCRILKFCVHTSKSFSHVCNSSMKSGIYPERFKYSIVQPINKKGDKTNMTNYRPILLITFSTILETLMFNRLNQQL